jgi:predicted CXXCH cytochrome family protein
MRKWKIALTTITLFIAGGVYAYGPHTPLDCLGCHDPHYAKGQKIFKVKNDVHPNPRTGKVIDHISALCLGCHNLPEFGGAGVKPIYLHMTHPVNVVPNPKIARVPEVLLRNDVIQCISCHDPHPSNPNWRYLRVNTDGGAKVGQFCLMCHPAKAETAFYGTAQKDLNVFSSMNEEVGPGTYKFGSQQLVIANPTPVYVQALGDYDNSLAPAYQTVPTQPWVFAPNKERLPQALKDIINNKKPASQKEQQPGKQPAQQPNR